MKELKNYTLSTSWRIYIRLDLNCYGCIIFLSITFWIQRRGSESDESTTAFFATIFINCNSSCCTSSEEKEKPTWNTKQVSQLFYCKFMFNLKCMIVFAVGLTESQWTTLIVTKTVLWNFTVILLNSPPIQTYTKPVLINKMFFFPFMDLSIWVFSLILQIFFGLFFFVFFVCFHMIWIP